LKPAASILLSAARFVLSMNCLHHTRIPALDHDLISTAYSPNRCFKPIVQQLEMANKTKGFVNSIPADIHRHERSCLHWLITFPFSLNQPKLANTKKWHPELLKFARHEFSGLNCLQNHADLTSIE